MAPLQRLQQLSAHLAGPAPPPSTTKPERGAANAGGLPPPVAPTGSSAVTRAPAEQFTQHEREGLRRADLDPSSPAAQFHAWFTAAQRSGRARHPETCTLSTASLPSGRVSARVVYLKELDARGGFVVYSNFGTSRKAADLASNPRAALTFWWEGLERQVRVEGRAERIPRAESQRYFDTRARGSRVGAWASRQSQVLRPAAGAAGAADGDGDDDGRAQLEEWVREAEERFEGKGGEGDAEGIPVPEFWGGLRIVPDRVEFWQGRASRLHDRFVYDRVEGSGEAGQEAKWTLERLSP